MKNMLNTHLKNSSFARNIVNETTLGQTKVELAVASNSLSLYGYVNNLLAEVKDVNQLPLIVAIKKATHGLAYVNYLNQTEQQEMIKYHVDVLRQREDEVSMLEGCEYNVTLRQYCHVMGYLEAVARVYVLVNQRREMSIADGGSKNLVQSYEVLANDLCLALHRFLAVRTSAVEKSDADVFVDQLVFKKTLVDSHIKISQAGINNLSDVLLSMNDKGQQLLSVGYEPERIHSVDTNSNLGHINRQCKIRVIISEKGESMEWFDWNPTVFAKYMTYALHTLTVMVSGQGNVMVNDLRSKWRGALDTALMLFLDGVEFEGLVNRYVWKLHSKAVVVFVNQEGLISHISDPLKMKNSFVQLSEEEEMLLSKISNFLTNAGWVNVLNEDGYAKHGYIQKHDNTLNSSNAFVVIEKGVMYALEQPKRIAVRLNKQVENKPGTFAIAEQLPVYTVSIPDDEYLEYLLEQNPQMKGMVTQDANVRQGLEMVFGTGQSYATDKLFEQVGVGRIKSGTNLGESGIKSVVTSRFDIKEQAGVIAHIFKGLKANGVDYAIVQGKQSAKSKIFMTTTKYNKGFKPVFVPVGHNDYFCIVVKQSSETVYMTESSACLAFEAVVADKTVTQDLYDAISRIVEKNIELSVTQMAFNDFELGKSEPLDVRLTKLEREGKIRRKEYIATTNKQIHDILQMQYGDNAVDELIESLSKRRKVADYRKSSVIGAAIGLDVVNESLSNNKKDSIGKYVKDVQLDELLVNLYHKLRAQGVDPEMWKGFTVKLGVYAWLLQQLVEAGKSFVNYMVNGEKAAFTYQTVEIFTECYEYTGDTYYVKNTDRAGKAIIRALAAAVNVMVYDETTRQFKNMDKAIQVFCKDIEKLNHSYSGKALNRIPGPGRYGTLISSDRLSINEYHTFMQEHLEDAANKWYPRADVESGYVAMVVKSPSLLFQSVNVMVYSQLAVSKEMSGSFTRQRLSMLYGNAVAMNPVAIVRLGNDTDGDKVLVMLITVNTAMKMGLLDDNGVIVNEDLESCITESGFGQHWVERTKDEMDLTVSLKDADLNKTNFDDRKRQITLEQLAEGAAESVREKALVGRNTNMHSAVIEYIDILSDMVVKFMELPEHTEMLSLLKDSITVKEFARDVVRFWADTKGNLVNIDAMNNVKSNGGVTVRVTDTLMGMTNHNHKSLIWNSYVYNVHKGVTDIKHTSIGTSARNSVALSIRNILRSTVDNGERVYKFSTLQLLNKSIKSFTEVGGNSNTYDNSYKEFNRFLYNLFVFVSAESTALKRATFDPITTLFEDSDRVALSERMDTRKEKKRIVQANNSHVRLMSCIVNTYNRHVQKQIEELKQQP